MILSPPVDLHRPRLSPGTRLNGIYEIDYAIGLGGMGEIYKGHLVETGDPVAVKMMLPELTENVDAFTLFRKEASALHHIHHDAIVRYYVFTVEPVLRRPYLAMEFVDGRTLADMLADDGPLTYEAALALLHRIALGLQTAHEHGIIHRDLSPDNIIVPNNDVKRAKIIDFGIARTTQHGTVIGSGFAGKFGYVSPEQLGLFGGEVTGKSDIYSLGLTIAQSLTGKAIDMGGSQVDVVEKRRRVPDLGAINMRIRPLLEQMLQPDPANRPESMAVIAAWAVGPTDNAGSLNTGKFPAKDAKSTVKRGTWKRFAAAAAVLALVAGAGSATFFFWSRLPISSIGPTRTATQGPASTTDGLGANPPNDVARPTSASVADKIKNYVQHYDGGNCFFVAPVAVSDHAAAIEAFGSSVEPFHAFDSAFARAIGFEADIGLRQITEQQCPAVSFLARLRGDNARNPHLEIDREDVRNGEVLNGLVDRYGSRSVALILVSDNGTVQNLSNLLKPGMDAKTFNIGMQRAEVANGRRPELLIAVVSPAPIPALQTNEPAKADQFFATLTNEVTKPGTTVAAVARYFMLQN